MATRRAPPFDDDLRTRVLLELRRARRHLLAGVSGATEDQMERPARRHGACMKWHLGHAAFVERAHLARLVGPLGEDWLRGVLAFGPQSIEDREGDLPPSAEILRWLSASRRLTESIALAIALDERALAVFRDLVDADHAEARFLRARRAELGLGPMAEPRSELLDMDTECVAPPRFHLRAWSAGDEESEEVSGDEREASVVSLEDRRLERAREALQRGHEHVRSGNLRAALRAFEEAARMEETADALTYQAWMHSLLGDLEKAERLCLRAIRLDPDFGNPYNDIGTICVQRRDVQSAIEWFQRAKRARRYEPRHFPFVNLARLYMTLGMPHEALRELEGALSLSPESDDIRTLIAELRTQIRES